MSSQKQPFIKDRGYQHLVLGLVSPIGCNTKRIKENIKSFVSHLSTETTRWEYCEIKVSQLFEEIPEIKDITEKHLECSRCKMTHSKKFQHKIIKIVQGNLLAEYFAQNASAKHGIIFRHQDENNMHAGLAPYMIMQIYSQGGIIETFNSTKNNHVEVSKVFVIDSIKRISEIKLLREVYGDSFFLIGITGSLDSRIKFLTNRVTGWGLSESEAFELIHIDAHQNSSSQAGCFIQQCLQQKVIKNLKGSIDEIFKKNKQEVEKCLEQADIYINHECQKDELYRILRLIFSDIFITPTLDEQGMFWAFGAAQRSQCLARQVGACILDDNGTILAIGHNDSPFVGGTCGEGNHHYNEYRDSHLGQDSNTIKISKNTQEITDSIMNKMNELQIVKPNDSNKLNKLQNIVFNCVKQHIKNLTEFGSPVHAEMSALLQAARNGIPINRGIMYVTLFSCHNCAKHMICAGIKRIVYVENYSKSLFEDLYSQQLQNIEIVPFTGIAPKRYFDFFSIHIGRSGELRRKIENDKYPNNNGKKYEGNYGKLRFTAYDLRVRIREIIACSLYQRTLEKISLVINGKNKSFPKSQIQKYFRKIKEIVYSPFIWE